MYTQLHVNFLETIAKELDGYEISFQTFYSLKEAKYELSQMPDFIFLDYLIENDNAQPETAVPLVDFLNEIQSDINLIVISGNAKEKEVQELRTLGVTNYIEKDKDTFTKLKSIILKLI